MGGAEFDDALLGPETLASAVFRYESAMAAVLGRDKLDDGILADFGCQERSIGDEGVILRGDHERGQADLGGDAFRADVFVIVLRVTIAELRGGDDVVELTDGSDGSQSGNGVALRKQLMLSRVAGHEALHETALVGIVVHALERIGASTKVQGGADSADTAQSLRYSGAKLSGHFGHQVSTHRVTGKKDLFEAVNI